ASLFPVRLVLGAEDVVERALERAHHVAQSDGFGRTFEGVASARSAARVDDAGALEILKDLLEIAERDALAPGDVLGLRRARRVVIGEVEHRAYAVPCLGLELQASFPIGNLRRGSLRYLTKFVKNCRPRVRKPCSARRGR